MSYPTTDIEAWNQYPAYQWVYNTTRLLDLQHIHWQPFADHTHTQALPVFDLQTHNQQTVSNIYIEPLDGTSITVTAALLKGQLKWHCVHHSDGTVSESCPGDLTLRVTGFCALYLKKYTGMITMSITGTVLTAVKLRAVPELCESLPESVQQHIEDFSARGICNF